MSAVSDTQNLTEMNIIATIDMRRAISSDCAKKMLSPKTLVINSKYQNTTSIRYTELIRHTQNRHVASGENYSDHN